MKQPQFQCANQAEYDFNRAMFRWLDQHKVEAQNVLLSLLHALMSDHFSDRPRIKGDLSPSMLQKLEAFMLEHAKENEAEGAKPIPVDENGRPIWRGSPNRRQRAREQGALCDMLGQLMKQVGAKPIRKAA